MQLRFFFIPQKAKERYGGRISLNFLLPAINCQRAAKATRRMEAVVYIMPCASRLLLTEGTAQSFLHSRSRRRKVRREWLQEEKHKISRDNKRGRHRWECLCAFLSEKRPSFLHCFGFVQYKSSLNAISFPRKLTRHAGSFGGTRRCLGLNVEHCFVSRSLHFLLALHDAEQKRKKK